MTPENMRIVIPEGCEVERIDTQDGAVVVTLKKKEPQLPKTWKEFCKMYPVKEGECSIDTWSQIMETKHELDRSNRLDVIILPDRHTTEAFLAIYKLIQLRNAYNGDWVPDWTDEERIYTIDFYKDEIWSYFGNTPGILYFRSMELRDEFMRNFRDLIEKLKPLYGIKLDSQQ